VGAAAASATQRLVALGRIARARSGDGAGDDAQDGNKLAG
jgi:hypothetical protein